MFFVAGTAPDGSFELGESSIDDIEIAVPFSATAGRDESGWFAVARVAP